MKSIRLPRWETPPVQRLLQVEACGKTLRLAVSGKGRLWIGLAIESDAKPEKAEDVLDHHAHTIVGKHKTQAAGLRAAEHYARKWLRARLAGEPAQLDEKPCTCDEIGPVLDFTDNEHREHCRLAKCLHRAIYDNGSQGWCGKCRTIAFSR